MGTRSGFGSAAAGLVILVLTLLLLGVGALLSVAGPGSPTLLNGGGQISVVLVAFLAVGLLLTGFVVARLTYGEAYLATLWATAPFIPYVAAAAVVTAFLTLPDSPAGLPHGVAALSTGSLAAAAVWIVSAVPLRVLASVEMAQTYSYLWLRQRTARLRALVDGIDPDKCPDGNRRRFHAVLKEANGYVGILEQALNHPDPDSEWGPGLKYVSATGYLNLWRLVYRAEERVLELDDAEAVDGAIYDTLRLEGSSIPGRDSLRAKLQLAVAALNPAAAAYLEAPAAAAAVQAEKAPAKAPAKAKAKATAQKGGKGKGKGKGSKKARTAAHGAIRVVRQAINEDRDGHWAGIVRARNRLLRTSLLTGIVAFVVLATAVLSDVPKNLLVGGVAFYLAGGLVGLIARLHAEVQSNSATDDYGLFEARLIQTPLLSGLAGVAGAFIVAVGTPMLTPATATTPLTSLPDVFDLSKNMIGLLSAAVFGLAPERLLKELQAYGDKHLKDLDSSDATGTATPAKE